MPSKRNVDFLVEQTVWGVIYNLYRPFDLYSKVSFFIFFFSSVHLNGHAYHRSEVDISMKTFLFPMHNIELFLFSVLDSDLAF